MRIISPSLLAADFSRLEEQIRFVEEAGATRLHLDVMDGHFVPNITFGPILVKAIRKLTKLHLETHLMISRPHRYIDQFIDAGSDTVIIHVEADTDVSSDLKQIHDAGVSAGISFKPQTPVSAVLPYLDQLDFVLIMSVEPGFGAQKFMESSLDSMRDLVKIRGVRNITLAVDGGVNLDTINAIYKTGIDVTIVGSGLFNAPDIIERYHALLNA